VLLKQITALDTSRGDIHALLCTSHEIFVMAKTVQNRFAGYKIHFMNWALRYEPHDFQMRMWQTSGNMFSLGLDVKHGLDF
jgi:hypothetical protein